MKTSEFDFNLPEELIAQHPLLDRKTSRMMVVHAKTQELLGGLQSGVREVES